MKKKILAIDSNPFILSIIKSTLESAGYRVFTALDGESGLEQFYHRQPDLVILDVMLPYMSGWEVGGRIRKRANIPVIIHTALTSAEYLQQAAKIGACNYLVKPVLPKTLTEQVEGALKPPERRGQPLPQSSGLLPLPELAVAEYA